MRFVRRGPILGLLALLPLMAQAQTVTSPQASPPTTFPPKTVPSSHALITPTPPLTFPPTIALPTAPPPHSPAASPPPVAHVPQPGGLEPFVGQPTTDPYNSILLDHAGTVMSLNGGQYVLRGDVRVRYRGYTLTSNRADVDLDRSTALFSGNVHLLAPNGQTVQGGPYGTVAIDLKNGTYHVTGSTTTVPPQDLGLGILLPVYIYGGTISGRPGFIDARNSLFTTCDFDNPHYAFGAKQLYLVPGSHLVAKYVTYYRDGHRLFSIPYLYFPLGRQLGRSEIIPQVGETPAEGFFAKVALAYALSSTLPGLLNLDLSQKQGLGTGIQQAYGDIGKPHEGSGIVTLYQQHDNATGLQQMSYGLTHQQTIGTVQVALNAQGQQNSSYISNTQSQSQNTQLNLTRHVGAFDTTLQNNLTQNNYGSGLSQTLTSTLENIYQPSSGRTRLDTRFDYSGVTQPSFGASNGNQKRLNSAVDYTQTGRVADVEILGNQYTQLSGGQGNGYGGLERLPEVRLATDATRLPLLRDLLLPMQTHINVSLGDFNEPSSSTHTTRAFFGIDTGQTTKTRGRSTLSYGGVYQQAFYGDNTAQYTLNGRASYQLRIGSRSQAGATYTYLRPYGYTPFQFDFVGTTNNTALNFTYQETRQFQLTLASAYDFNQTRSLSPGLSPTPWQNLAAQLVFKPSPAFQLQATSAYDPNHGKLLDLTNNLQVRAPGGFSLDLATRYDPVSHRFSQTNYAVNLPFFRDPNPAEDAGYRLQAIGGYNGITDQFSYEGFALTRNWHDWSASLVYQDDRTNSFQSGQTVTFNFQLRAFPAFQPFNIGQFGQGLDPGLGAVY